MISLQRCGFATPWLVTSEERGACELVHRVYETYLGEQGLPADHVHEAADRAEHFISPASEEEMDDAEGNPRVDPHGREIPH